MKKAEKKTKPNLLSVDEIQKMHERHIKIAMMVQSEIFKSIQGGKCSDDVHCILLEAIETERVSRAYLERLTNNPTTSRSTK